MKSIGNKSKNIKADYNQDGSMSEIRQLTLLLDSASGLDDSMLTLEAVYTGTRGRGIGAKVKYVNRSDGRLSQVQMGDVLHSINGQMVKTCTFTAIQNILKNSFQSPVEDDFSHVSSSSTKSSVVVVALTFLHHPTPTSYNHTDSIVTDHPNVMHIRELVGTTNTLSYDNSASYHQQRWRHQNVRAVTTPSSERNLDKLENSGKRALHSQRISVPQSKLQFDSPSLHDTSQSFTKEEVLHSIFSPVPTWEEPHGNANISMSSQSRSSLQSPYNNRRSVVNLQGTHNLGHCERTPQSLETTRLRTNEERSTTTKPPRGLGKENPLESIPEYVLETSYNIMTETPSFLTTDDESKHVGGPGRHSSSLPHNTLNDFSSISDTDDPISIFLSPIDTDTKKGTTSYCDAGKSLSFSYSDTYFSPSSQACQETNSSSHDVNITLEMFDLNYVNSCSSPTKLKSIISQLSTPNKKYPELLRLAKKRLTTLQHQQTMSSLEGNSDTPLNHDYQCRQYASNSKLLAELNLCKLLFIYHLSVALFSYCIEHNSLNFHRTKSLIHSSQEIIDNTFFTTDACSTSSGNKSYGLKSIASKSIGGSEYIDSFLSNYRTPLSEVDEDDIIPVICDKGSPLNPIKQQPELMAPVECEESLSNHSNQDYSQRKKCFTAYDAHDTRICSGSENISCDSYHVTGLWREECQDCQRLKHEMTQMEEDLATALAAHSALSSQLTEALEEKDQLKHDLTSQISKLMNKLKSLEAVWASQKDAYCLRIASLEKAKNNAERDAIMLEEAVLETSSQAKAMKSQLLKKIQDLTLSIASEKESSSRALDTALEKQAKIHAQVEELTMKLHYRERKEVEMRRLLERDHQRKIKFAEDRSRSTLNSLSASLEETRKIVDRLTVENKELKLAIDELENERRDALEFADVSC
jgi:hypothetical protein